MTIMANSSCFCVRKYLLYEIVLFLAEGVQLQALPRHAGANRSGAERIGALKSFLLGPGLAVQML